jgi:hypothetical protein
MAAKDETPKAARERRLAEALRANLRRRKEQARGRPADAPPAAEDGHGPEMAPEPAPLADSPSVR